jgi:hypothetical protein
MAKLIKAIETGEVKLPDGIEYTGWNRQANTPATFRRTDDQRGRLNAEAIEAIEIE